MGLSICILLVQIYLLTSISCWITFHIDEESLSGKASLYRAPEVIDLYWSSESPVFLSMETPGALSWVGSWTSYTEVRLHHCGFIVCSISSVIFTIGVSPVFLSIETPGALGWVGSWTSCTEVELHRSWSIVCSIIPVTLSIGSTQVSRVSSDISLSIDDSLTLVAL